MKYISRYLNQFQYTYKLSIALCTEFIHWANPILSSENTKVNLREQGWLSWWSLLHYKEIFYS
jgi:hypothetical protein